MYCAAFSNPHLSSRDLMPSTGLQVPKEWHHFQFSLHWFHLVDRGTGWFWHLSLSFTYSRWQERYQKATVKGTIYSGGIQSSVTCTCLSVPPKQVSECFTVLNYFPTRFPSNSCCGLLNSQALGCNQNLQLISSFLFFWEDKKKII